MDSDEPHERTEPRRGISAGKVAAVEVGQGGQLVFSQLRELQARGWKGHVVWGHGTQRVLPVGVLLAQRLQLDGRGVVSPGVL